MVNSSPNSATPLDELCVNTLRMLSAEAVEKAKSGHPGLPMGAAAPAYVLWTRFLKHNPQNPLWPDRDRFILSAGHGSMLLYSLLHLTGYDLSLEDLKNFRQWAGRTPGHPERLHTPGVECTTGPLGQGFANGVGLALAEAFLAAHFNRPGHKIVQHHIYALVSDGDLMEGITHEAASLAGHLKLGKLIYLYDDNHISIEGSTDLAFTEDRLARFKAYGWHTQQVTNGNDLVAIELAIQAAQAEKERPSLIAIRTQIGFGSPNRQDTAGAHGEPLGASELALTKQNLGWPLEPGFYIPPEALHQFRLNVPKGAELEADWQDRFKAYQKAYPDLAQEWQEWVEGRLPLDWEQALPFFKLDPKGQATRTASGTILNALAAKIPNLIGGSADLAPSNKTWIKASAAFQPGDHGGRNVHFGVREHAMSGILNGLALHGGLIPFGGTFLIFSDYMRPSMRLAAMMGLRVLYILTHDSIGLGEDGPTHQPIEHLAALRAMPNLTVIRPCDANETTAAWRYALQNQQGPTALILSRQDLPVLDRNHLAPAADLAKGAYVLLDPPSAKPEILLLATGSEVHLMLQAAQALSNQGIAVRVISMPSWELFEKQPQEYQRQVLPPECPLRLAVEAGVTQGWERYVGDKGKTIGLDHFGASAPYQVLYKEFGLTAERIASEALHLLGRDPESKL